MIPKLEPNSRITARMATELFEISPARIARWKHRRMIVVQGTTRGQSLFRLGDLLELQEAAENDPRSRSNYAAA